MVPKRLLPLGDGNERVKINRAFEASYAIVILDCVRPFVRPGDERLLRAKLGGSN